MGAEREGFLVNVVQWHDCCDRAISLGQHDDVVIELGCVLREGP